MQMSDKLKERFVRDCKIPIRLYAEPYFTERLELLDKYYGTLEKWKAFCEEINKYSNEEEYFSVYNSTKEAAMDFVKSSDGWKAFNSLDMNQFAIKNKNFPSKDVFKPTNIGREFISIDIKKANFSVLNTYNPNIFGNVSTWEDFIRKFTDSEYIINSKYIREVIMGNCNPSRVITFEKYITDGILTNLLEAGINPSDIVFFSNDEIVVDVTKLDYLSTMNTITNVADDVPVPLRVEYYKLTAVKKRNKIIGYIKNLSDGSYDFKCFNNQDLLLVLRTLNGENIRSSDFVFEHEGYLAKYIDTPVIIFIKEDL